MNSLSRNTPVALIMGAAGFLGSHLVDSLLEKNIQVVGVDDLTSGTLANLADSNDHPKFQFLNQSAQVEIPLEFPRLDYAIFVLSENIPSFSTYKRALENFLKLAKTHKSKILFISSVENYDQSSDGATLKKGEEFLAEFTTANNLNARVLRLSAVFGPRMHFRESDPLIKLIHDHILNTRTKPPSLDFITRAIFISDAVHLIIKTLLSGVTAQKIFDGALLHPIKIVDLNQLMEAPVEMPAWPTPNLLKTQKELAWKVTAPLPESLRATLEYFENHPERVSDQPISVAETPNPPTEVPTNSYKPVFSLDPNSQKLGKSKNNSSKSETKRGFKKRLGFYLGLAVISYAFFYPLIDTALAVGESYYHLKQLKFNLAKSDFGSAGDQAKAAKQSAHRVEQRYSEWEFIKKVPSLGEKYSLGERWVGDLNLVAEAANQTVVAATNLNRGAKVISGEGSGDLIDFYQKSSLGFSQAEQKLALVNTDLDSVDASRWPKIVSQNFISTRDLLKLWQDRLTSARVLANLIPEVVGGEKNKLVLLMLRSEGKLKPSGGEIASLLELEFEAGRLKNISPGKTADLKMANSELLADLNKEGDFGTFAKKWQVFYARQTGKNIDSIVALDFKALSTLLDTVGPISLANQGSNASLLAIENSESVLGTSTDLVDATLVGVTKNLLLVSNQDWSKLSQNIDNLINQKHLMVYNNDPKVLAYLTRANWSGRISKQTDIPKGQLQDLVAVLEDNQSSVPNSKVQRSFKLDSKINSTGSVKHQLIINYNYPEYGSDGEDYLSEIRVFLSAGTKLEGAFWGTTEVTNSVSSFSDYGRAGYSLKILLSAKEQKSLTLDLVDAVNFELVDGMGQYRVEILKQAGSLEDEKFDYKLEFPEAFKLTKTSKQDFNKGVGELNTSLDLDQDQLFEFQFKAD